MSDRMKELQTLLEQEQISLPADFAEKLLDFESRLLETNKVMNLTAITEPEEMMKKHYWDSIYPLSKDLFPENATVVDVGCGAGFPSLPLKLARPDLWVFLLDSLQKRLNFLDGVIEGLSLERIRTLHSRAEDAGKNPVLRGHFDIAVSRAVAELSKLCEYCLPLVRVGGALIAYKGAGADEELESAKNAIEVLGAKVEQVYHYTLPGEEDKRAIIVLRKVSRTPEQYPRSPKLIKDKPL
ncbi:MAG: 16S rRNA (guanine(527)-N(7))-methyltransferase RsmG [Clostridia bacterium]|nr:16S rRNA (guanine(527)-N(7))-methyltransferase RsmG [Clostridia bacterium]